MKISKARLELIIKEELDMVLQERNLRKEHRGKPCKDKTGKERRECEQQAEDAIKRRDKKTQKKREQSANDEELEALGRGKVYGSNPTHKTRRDQINPDIGKELRQEKKSKDRLNPNVKAKFKCEEVSEMLTRDGLINADTQLYDTGEWFLIRKDAFDEIITQEIIETIEHLKSEMDRSQMVVQENKSAFQQRCEQAGYRTFEQLIRAFNSLVLSSKGELFKEPKK